MLNFASKSNYEALVESAIIDLRSKAQFSERHIKYSCNIESANLESRLHELPESRQIVSIIGEQSDLLFACDFLTCKGYKILFQIEAISFFKNYNELDWFESGKLSQRLWKPSLVVKIFREKYAQLISGNKNVKKEPLKGLDLACGAGRDSIFMAVDGWDMTAVDYMPSALSRVNSLADNNQCKVKTIELDLEKTKLNDDQSPFPVTWQGYYDLVIVSRYLHRPLLRYIDELLKPGGFIVYQTFLEGCERFGSPKNPRYLLKYGELANVFSSYKIFYDQLERLSDGRPTNAFIAQKQNAIDILGERFNIA